MDPSSITGKECAYTQDMEDHIKSDHDINQLDGPTEAKIPPETVMSAEERKLQSDFIRTYVFTSTMGKCEMWCQRCNNQWFNKKDFNNHMKSSHDKKSLSI